MSAAEIDAIVHELYRRESATFDCMTCANCCKGISPLLDDEDIARLSVGLGMSADRVIADYLVRNDEYGGWSFNGAPCPLLENNRCSCYEHRPHDCASYPHLHKDRFVGRLSNTVRQLLCLPGRVCRLRAAEGRNEKQRALRAHMPRSARVLFS